MPDGELLDPGNSPGTSPPPNDAIRTEQEREMDRWLAGSAEPFDRWALDQPSGALEQPSWPSLHTDVFETPSLPKLDFDKLKANSVGGGAQSERRRLGRKHEPAHGFHTSMTGRDPLKISNNILPSKKLAETVLTHFLIKRDKRGTIASDARVLLKKFQDCLFGSTGSMKTVPVDLGEGLVDVPVTLNSIEACKETLAYLIDIFPPVLGKFLQVSLQVLDKFLFDPHPGDKNSAEIAVNFSGHRQRARQRLKCYAGKFDPGHAVSSHTFDLRNLKLRVSNPRAIAYAHFRVPFEISD